MSETIWTPATMGRKGGSARVKKGAAVLSKRKRRALGKAGALARWGSKKPGRATNSGPELDRVAS